MGRRRRGWYWAYIVRPATEKESVFMEDPDRPRREEARVMYWTGRSVGGAETWHDLAAVGKRFFLTTEAEAEALLLVGRCPDLLGKVRVVTHFISEPKEKRKRRAAKAVGDRVGGVQPGGDVPPRGP